MPPVESSRNGQPLALAVLSEELATIDADFDAVAAAPDGGEREARKSDLLRAIDRYLRLECEVLHPVLARKGVDHAVAAASNAQLRSSARELASCPAGSPAPLDDLRSRLRSHLQAQQRDLFPRAARALGDEMPGLAVELQEVRRRMSGAFGV